MPDRNKSAVSVFLAALFALMLGLSAFGQTTTNIPLHMFVSDHTHMWSTNDPFGFLVLSNLQVQVAGKLGRAGDTSTSQTLVSATVADTLSLSTAGGTASLSAGQMSWDPDDRTLAVGLGDGVVMQVGQELPVSVVNQTGATLTNGCFVAYDGTVAASGRVKAKLFVADGTMRPEHFLGMVTSDDGSGGIANNGEGKVTRFGKVRGRNTLGTFDGESWVSNGIPLYASTNRPGRLTQYRPQAPQPSLCVGFLAYRHANMGVIDIAPHTHGSLVELDDVDGAPLNASGLFPVWDNARRVFDFTANVGSFAGTASVSAVRSELLLSNQTALAAASSVRSELLLSNQTASALAQAASNTAASALSLAGSAAASSAAASNLAASVAGTALSASNTAALAAADAALALVVAYEAEGSAAAAFGLAGTYYAFATNAADVASLARADATNALAIAQSIRGANRYPHELWSWNLEAAVPEELQTFSKLVLSEGGTAVSVAYTRPAAPAWTYTGYPVLTNALTSATNQLAEVSHFLLSASNAVPAGAGIPYPLEPVSGATDSWQWDVAGSGFTNTYRITAATNVSGGVSVYWSQTNAFTGFLYGTNFASPADYTTAVRFSMAPLVDGMTGDVTVAFAFLPASSSSNSLAFKDYVDYAVGQLEAFDALVAESSLTINGQPVGFTTNSSITVEGGSGGPSWAELYTLMSTSRVERVWEGTNAWYTFASNTIVRRQENHLVQWRLTNDTYNLTVDAPYPIPDVGASYAVSDSSNLGYTTEQGSGGDDELSWFSLASDLYTSYLFGPLYDQVKLTGGPGDIYLTPIGYVVTNTVTYYLQTNLVPPETWSRGDMDAWISTNAYTYGVVNTYVTNWMEFGNAGQVWVTGLASDAAQVILNGHLAASDPHAGKYVTQSQLTAYPTFPQVSNMTSQLLLVMTNSTGTTTGQVWRTGGVVYTNFFASSEAALVCPTNWTRPACWPVAAGYTVDTWLTPETNLVKMLIVASPRETISFLRGPGGSFQVDWYGDGTHVSNYANGAAAVFSYPPTDYGRVIPIVAGYTNGWRVENVGGWAGYNPTTTNMFAKVSRMLEFVGEPVAIGGGAMQANTRWLRNVVIGASTVLPLNWLYASRVERVDLRGVQKLPNSAFQDAGTPQEITAPALTNIGVSAFSSCTLIETAHFPLCQTLGVSAFAACSSLHRLTPMPNLVSAGIETFKHCNLSFVTITNFVGNLQLTPAAPQFLDFRDNPGTPEVKAWYFSGSVSNDLESLGWRLTL